MTVETVPASLISRNEKIKFTIHKTSLELRLLIIKKKFIDNIGKKMNEI
jgi:hypothetical protein